MINISIIIPVYNGEKTIPKTLNSVLGQKYKSFEIIIVNDGSTDGTQSIIDTYQKKNKRIKIIKQKNSGVSIARNVGIRNSKGKFLCFLDADDYYDDSFLEEMINMIRKKDMDLCYCGYNTYPLKEKEKIKRKINLFTDKNVLLNYINGKIPAHTSTWLIKKSIIINNNIFFRENVSWGEDQEFFYELLARSRKITYVPKYLTYYRNEEAEGRLSNFSLKKIEQDYEFIIRIVDNKKINSSREIEKALLNYRLPTLLTNNLLTALENGYQKSKVKHFYKKYSRYLSNYEFVNGFRSIKTNLLKIRLKRILKNS